MTRRSTAYRFSKAAHWRRCTIVGAEAIGDSAIGVVPIERYASEPTHTFWSPGAFALAVAGGGELLWRDAHASLHRMLIADGIDEPLPATTTFATTPRLVATADAWWAFAPGSGSVRCYERDSLALRWETDLPGMRIIDIARGRRQGVSILAELGQEFLVVDIDGRGTIRATVTLDDLRAPTLLATLPGSDRIAVLHAGGGLLSVFDRGQVQTVASILLGGFRPCFVADRLASDGRRRWVLSGRDGDDFGGNPHILVLDRDGNLIDRIALIRTATTLAADSRRLLVGDAEGVHLHPSALVAGTQGSTELVLLTPLLHAPDRLGPSRWLRAQAEVLLPAGTSAELAIAEVSTQQQREQIEHILGDPTCAPIQKLRDVDVVVGQWNPPIVLRAGPDNEPESFAAPMHDARAADALVRVVLRAAPRAALPRLQSLEVLYGDSAMAKRLPAQYGRRMELPGDLVRALVGVMETTTQDLDRRIAGLGSLIDPSTSSGKWLDTVARWLGLPWDDALDEATKRCILRHAAELARMRGTRAGVATLLACLLPGAPARFRIVDIGADVGYATLGGTHYEGSRLPTLLTGLPRDASVLSRRARLGRARLPCHGRTDDAIAPWRGVVRIELDVAERARLEPWLPGMLASMMPATARMRLQWRAGDAAHEVLTEAGKPLRACARVSKLGVDAVTGSTRLSARRNSPLG